MRHLTGVLAALLLLLACGPPLAAQETDRQLLEAIRAQIDAHLSGGPVTPPAPDPEPPAAGAVSIERYDGADVGGPHHGISAPVGSIRSPTIMVARNGAPAANVLVEWTRLQGGSISATAQRTNVNGASQVGWTLAAGDNRIRACAESACVEFRATGGSGGGAAPPPAGNPDPPAPPSGSQDPPAPGPDSQGWSGNTIAVRIIESGSRTGRPVPVTIVSGGQARTFHRSTMAGRTVQVPRGAVTIRGHFERSASAGVGQWGFSALKFKAMRNADFPVGQVEGANQSTWEPLAASNLWGGHLRTWCGSQAPTRSPLPDFWEFEIPASVMANPAIDYIVVWVMDHQVPRPSC